ncbi:MAG: multicopper oxidase family protein [Gammaproteobacteria bacterium]|nr:multicopper oxidase family protein [Gammaproteobacteria bacterium]
MSFKMKTLLKTLLLIALPTVAFIAVADENPEHVHEQNAGDMSSGQEMDAMNMEHHDHASMGHTMDNEVKLSGTLFSKEIINLPDAVSPQVVTLKDGDTYTITAEYVKKQVGNHTLRMLAYNRSIPGPILKIEQDSEIQLNFINETDFEQTIHSHGVRIDNRYDGVPGITQNAVAPGESFEYKIKFKDAGVFWYHPHTREDYGQEMGLYGNYLISPDNNNYWNPVSREIPLVIDDILIENGQVADFYREFTNFALLGRFGNEHLINGEKNYSLATNKGEVIRFYITNVSNTRTYNLSIPNVQLKVVGGDLGKYEHEYFAKNIVISPAERVVVEAMFSESGDYILTHTQPDNEINLMSFVTNDMNGEKQEITDSFYSLRHNSDVADEFTGFRRHIDSAPDKTLKLTISLADQEIDHSEHAHMDMQMDSNDHSQHSTTPNALTSETQPSAPEENLLQTIQWDDPGQSDRTNITPDIFWELIDEETGKTSLDIDDWVFKQDDLVKIRLINDENADHIMQHPVHVHGQQFVVLSVDGMPNNNLVWKDTALVFPGQTVDLLVKMSNTGEWMLHCHISEHLHAGMAMIFRVEDNNGVASGDAYRSSASGHSHQH